MSTKTRGLASDADLDSDVAKSAVVQEELLGYRKSMNGFSVDSDRAALVVVDLQYGSAATGYGFQAMFESIGHGDVVREYMDRIEGVVLPSVQRMLESFRTAGAPVVFLTVGSGVDDYSDMPPQFRRAVRHFEERGIQVPYAKAGTREIQVRDEIAPVDGESVLRKNCAGAFASTEIDSFLRAAGVTQTVVAGVATNYCVHSTLRGAADRGYDCVIVEDACADVTADMHEVGIRSMEPLGRVMTASAVCEELGVE